MNINAQRCQGIRARIQATPKVMYAVTCAAIVADLSVLDRTGALRALERPVYGLLQRSLFLVWFVWCAGVGFALYGASGKAWGPRFASSGY